MAPFFDLMIIGEGEEVNNEVLALFRQAQQAGWSKTRFLETAAKIQGVLIPSFYVPHWNPDGTLHAYGKMAVQKLIKDALVGGGGK